MIFNKLGVRNSATPLIFLNMKQLFYPFLLLLLSNALLSCGGSSSSKDNSQLLPKPFQKAPLPMYINSEEEAYEYIANNYWNRFLDSSKVYSRDTTLVGGVSRDEFMKAYSEYVQVLNMISPKSAYNAQLKLIKGAERLKLDDSTSTVFNNIVTVSEYVLYDPNSDFRNEDFYLPIASTLAESALIDSATKGRYQVEAANCSLNRIGEVATDFNYTTKEGKRSSLHKIKADYTLMFFSNPGCNACKEIIDALNNSAEIKQLEYNGVLKVLNIYIDEELEEWYKYMSIYPKEWINAYNEELSIRTKNLYDVRAIPSLYLLDSQKRVILKDAPPMRVMGYINTRLLR